MVLWVSSRHQPFLVTYLRAFLQTKWCSSVFLRLSTIIDEQFPVVNMFSSVRKISNKTIMRIK